MATRRRRSHRSSTSPKRKKRRASGTSRAERSRRNKAAHRARKGRGSTATSKRRTTKRRRSTASSPRRTKRRTASSTAAPRRKKRRTGGTTAKKRSRRRATSRDRGWHEKRPAKKHARAAHAGWVHVAVDGLHWAGRHPRVKYRKAAGRSGGKKRRDAGEAYGTERDFRHRRRSHRTSRFSPFGYQ